MKAEKHAKQSLVFYILVPKGYLIDKQFVLPVFRHYEYSVHIAGKSQ